MDSQDLVLRFIGIDLVSQIANGIANAVQGLTNNLGRNSEEQAGAWNKIGIGAMVAGGLILGTAVGLTAFATASVGAAMKFQQAMELIHTQAGASQADVDRLSAAVLALAPAVGMGPDELAAGLYHIVSVGVPAAQQMDVLKTAALGAKVGIADMETVTNALAATMVSNIKGVSGASDAMGQLNAIVGAGNMRMQDLVGALSTGILPAAQNFGLSLRDVGSALATLTDLGTPAEEAATRLRMTFSMMGAPTAAAAKELATIGIKTTELGDIMRNKGLIPALQDLHEHLVNSGLTATEQAEVLSRAFGGGRSSAAILGLIQNIDRLNMKQQQITDTSGNFGKSVGATQDTLAYKTSQLNASWQTLQVTIGTALIPVITKLVVAATPIIAAIANWIEHNRGLVGTLAPLVIGGMALLGVLLLVVGAILLLATPVTLVVVGLGLLAVAIVLAVTHWKDITTWLGNAWHAVTSFLGAHRDLIDNIPLIGGPLNLVITLVQLLIDHWHQITTTVGEVFSTLGRFGDWLRNTFGPILHDIAGFVGGLANDISGLAGAASKIPVLGGIGGALGIPGFQGGGVVPGPIGVPRLILAHGGETVTPVGGGGGMDDVAELLAQQNMLLQRIVENTSGPRFSTQAYSGRA